MGMTLRQRMALWLLGERKESHAARLIALSANGQPVWTPKEYEKLAEEGYGTNVTVYACVNEIARGMAGIKWGAYHRDADGEQEAAKPNHPLAKLLKRPNPRQGLSSFLEAVAGYWMLSGNSYVDFVGPNYKKPLEMWPLRPDRVKIVPDRVQTVRGYLYELEGRQETIAAELVMHTKLFNPLDDWYGMSPIEVASRVIDSDNESVKWNKALLQNSARPSGALVATTPLGEQAFQDLKNDIDAKYSSQRNAGRPLLLEGGLDWKEMGLSPVDMDWLQGRKMTKREIAQAFGVPPELIGDSESKTYSNYREARAAFYMETVLPLCDRLRDDFNNYFAPIFGEDVVLSYDPDSIEALQEDQTAKWTRVAAADFLTINEKRKALGYDKVPGGDVILVNGGVMPLEMALNPPEPALPDVDPEEDLEEAPEEDPDKKPKTGEEEDEEEEVSA